MLRLIVMRHAKSDWSSGAQTDHERPLNARGREAAPRIAQKLVDLGWSPTVVLSSDSQRTTETYTLMAPLLDDHSIEWRSEFYHGAPKNIIDALEEQTESGPVLVLGHNPGWEAFTSELAAEAIPMTTANAALFESSGDDWATALHDVSFTFVDVLRPKEID